MTKVDCLALNDSCACSEESTHETLYHNYLSCISHSLFSWSKHLIGLERKWVHVSILVTLHHLSIHCKLNWCGPQYCPSVYSFSISHILVGNFVCFIQGNDISDSLAQNLELESFARIHIKLHWTYENDGSKDAISIWNCS